MYRSTHFNPKTSTMCPSYPETLATPLEIISENCFRSMVLNPTESTAESTLSTAFSDNSTKVSTVSNGYTLPTKIIYFSISSFGILSNLFVIFVILLNGAMRKRSTNILIVNQAAIDTAAAVFLCMTAIFPRGRKFTRDNITDEMLCRIFYSGLLLWSFLVASTYSIMSMTFERFLAVVHPIVYKTRFSTSRISIGLLMCAPWIVGLLINASYEIPTTRILTRGSCAVLFYWLNDTVKNAVGALVTVFEYFLPLVFLAFCYIKMAVVIHRRVEPSRVNQGQAMKNESMARVRNDIVKTLIAVGALFVVCWTPNIFNLLLKFLGYEYVSFAGNFYNATVYMVFFSCCVNPVVYLIRYKEFQKAVRQLFSFKVQIKADSGGQIVSTVS